MAEVMTSRSSSPHQKKPQPSDQRIEIEEPPVRAALFLCGTICWPVALSSGLRKTNEIAPYMEHPMGGCHDAA
jgi:hypothetical protein